VCLQDRESAHTACKQTCTICLTRNQRRLQCSAHSHAPCTCCHKCLTERACCASLPNGAPVALPPPQHAHIIKHPLVGLATRCSAACSVLQEPKQRPLCRGRGQAVHAGKSTGRDSVLQVREGIQSSDHQSRQAPAWLAEQSKHLPVCTNPTH